MVLLMLRLSPLIPLIAPSITSAESMISSKSAFNMKNDVYAIARMSVVKSESEKEEQSKEGKHFDVVWTWVLQSRAQKYIK